MTGVQTCALPIYSVYLFEKDNPLTRKAAPIIQAKQTELALVQFILSKNHAPQVQDRKSVV